MTVAALWTKHRPLALAIAAQYRIPNQDAGETRQDALCALWEAATAYEKAKGPFPPFARLVVTRRLKDRLKEESRMCRGEAVELHQGIAALPDGDGLQLQLVISALPSLSTFERASLADSLNGYPMTANSSRAAYRARQKLRRAA